MQIAQLGLLIGTEKIAAKSVLRWGAARASLFAITRWEFSLAAGRPVYRALWMLPTSSLTFQRIRYISIEMHFFFFVRSDVCCGCWIKCKQKRLYVWSKEKTSKKRSTVWGWRLGLARSWWGNLQPLQLAVYEQGGPFGVSSDVFEICKASISVATFGLPRLICGMVPRCNSSSSLLSIL